MKRKGNRLPDEADRRTAATDFDRNLAVLAGAGTGKTSLLVERVLNAIGSGRVTLDEVAAITFTEKAAAEMRQRIAEGLEELRAVSRRERGLDEEVPAGRALAHLERAGIDAGEIARRALQGLEQIDRSKILTIHAFCSELLRAHPLESGIDPDFEVDTGEQAAVLCASRWEDYLARELGPDAARAECWSRVLGSFSLGELAEVAQSLSGFDTPVEILSPPYGAETARELLGEEAGRLEGEIDALRARATSVGNALEHFFDSIRKAFGRLAAEGLDAFAEDVAADPSLHGSLTTSRTFYVSKKLEGASASDVKGLANECRRLGRMLWRADESFGPRVIEAVAPFALGFREELLRRGWISFDGLLVLARNLLRDHPEVRRRLKRRYRMLLVDEFQDTDPLQYEIVLYLAEVEDDSANDAYQARLQPGKLFVVGDPKQSIYRFRGADYGAFRRAIGRVGEEDGRTLNLVANFRSVPGLTEPVNELFRAGSSTCWFESGCQPSYEPIRAVRKERDGPRVDIWTLDLPAATLADVRRRKEGELIADAIRSLVREKEVCGYRNISILFRTFGSIPQYLRPLRERGIPFVVDGGKDFLKRPEIAQSLAVLRTMAQPSDPAALLAFLRSPAGAVTDAELAAYGSAGLPWDWRIDPDDSRVPRIKDRFALLRRLRDETRTLPADAVVRRVLEATLLLPLAAAAFEGAQRVANLQKLVTAAGALAWDGRMSLEDVVDQLQEGGIAELESDSPLADDVADAVRITSIHKMKGLENDWVILPDLAREGRKPWSERVECEIGRLAGGRRALGLKIGQVTNPAWIRQQLEGERHEQAEETRVLYVALTRARERLVLVAAPARKPTRWFRALDAWGYDAKQPPSERELLDGRVRQATKPAPRGLDGRLAEVPARAGPAVDRYHEAVNRLRRQAAAPFRAPSEEEGDHEARWSESATDALPRRVGRSRDLGKAAGLTVHRSLEHWDGHDTGSLLDASVRIGREIASDEDLDPEAVEREVRIIVSAFLDSPLSGELHRVECLGREIPLLLQDADGRSWRGSIDLLYRDDDGSIVVADYKTDDEDDDAALVERYRQQLEIYRQAVRRGLDLPVSPRAELWLLRSGRRVPIPELPPDGTGADDPPVQGSLG